jgi:hypothetical protein
MKRRGTALQDYCTNTDRNRKRWYGHVSIMNESMIQAKGRKNTARNKKK